MPVETVLDVLEQPSRLKLAETRANDNNVCLFMGVLVRIDNLLNERT